MALAGSFETQPPPAALFAPPQRSVPPSLLQYSDEGFAPVNGGSATGSLAIDVDDDTPVVTASTTQPVLTVDESNLATNATASFAGAAGSGYDETAGRSAIWAADGTELARAGADPGEVVVATLTGRVLR